MTLEISFINKQNNIGDKWSPWGTPKCIFSEIYCSYLTICVWPDKKVKQYVINLLISVD